MFSSQTKVSLECEAISHFHQSISTINKTCTIIIKITFLMNFTETTAVYLENEWQNAELLNINAGVMCTE
jgi:phenylalanyl-tRNA synthetase alpha subunit